MPTTITAEGKPFAEESVGNINGAGAAKVEMPLEAVTRTQDANELIALRSQMESYKRAESIAAYNMDRLAEIQALNLTAREVDDLAAPWEMLLYQLKQNIQGMANWPGLQMCTLPYSADWNDPKYGKWYMWRKWGDSLPVWGPSFRFDTANKITDAYYLFITNIDIPLPNQDEYKKALAAKDQYMAATDALNDAFSQVGDHWKAFNEKQSSLPPARRLTFDQWFARFDGRKIFTLQQDVKIAEQAYSSYLIKAYRGYAFVADLLSNFDNPAYQVAALVPGTDDPGTDPNMTDSGQSGLVEFYRTYAITPDLGRWIETCKALAGGNTPPRISFTLNKTSMRSKFEGTEWAGAAGLLGGFFSFGAQAKGGRTSIDTSSEHFSLHFEALNWTTFTVTPGPWWNGLAVKVFKDGPWIADGPVAQKGGAKFLWGPNGIFSLMTSQIIVAYRPKITVSMTEAEFSKVTREISVNGGFSIGPFAFGAKYNKRNEDVKFDESSLTLTAQDSTDIPQVVAVVSSVLPDFK